MLTCNLGFLSIEHHRHCPKICVMITFVWYTGDNINVPKTIFKLLAPSAQALKNFSILIISQLRKHYSCIRMMGRLNTWISKTFAKTLKSTFNSECCLDDNKHGLSQQKLRNKFLFLDSIYNSFRNIIIPFYANTQMHYFISKELDINVWPQPK